MRLISLLLLCPLLLALVAACSARQEESESRPEVILDADGRALLSSLRREMEGDASACQRILLDPVHAGGLRDSREFRSLIEEMVVHHQIHELQLVADEEPGEWIDIEGFVEDAAGKRVAGALVRIFATDAEGLYHPDHEGERIPRIFGSMISDEQGRFRFRTVRPGPYPGTRQARLG